MTWFGLVMAKTKGESIADDMAIDADGNPTTDPTKAMDGALLPFDRNYKGSGLGMVVELLAGPLVSASFTNSGADEWGNVFIALDPNLLVDANKFKSDSAELVVKLKAARRATGINEIRLPGERAQALRAEAQKSGMVDVEEAILKQLGYL